MTRLRVMQGILAVLVVIMIWSWTREPPPSPVPEKRQRQRSASKEGPLPTLEPGASVRRNLFEYGEAPAATATRPGTFVAPLPVSTPAVLADAPAVPLKLVGLVHQGAGLRAALAVHGEVVLVAPGQEVAGYKIVSIDEDAGVVLTAPDGRTIELRREETK